MISQTLRQLLKSQELLLRIFWWVCTLSIIVYIGIAYFLGLRGTNTGGLASTGTQLQLVFSVLAVLVAFLPTLIKCLMLSEKMITKAISREINNEQLATNTRTGQIDQEKLRKIETLNESEKKLLLLSGHYFSPALISLVFNETIAVFGLVLSVVIGKFELIIPFAAAALLLNVVHFPRLGVFIEQISASRMLNQ
jgi:hypothetical protein